MSLLSSKTTTDQTSTRSVGDGYQDLNAQLKAWIANNITDPSAALQPLRVNSMDRINTAYAGAPTKLAASLGKRGYGSSGKGAGAYWGIERARMGDLSSLTGTLDTAALQERDNSMSLAERLIQGMSSTNTQSTQTNNPGFGGLISGALGAATTLFGLNALLKGGGNGGGGFAPQNYTPGGAYDQTPWGG